MLSDYANESITLKVKGAVNGANEATFTTTTILGRLQQETRMVRDRQGQLVQSTSQLFTKSAVALDDKVTMGGQDFPVINVAPMKDLDGTILWREVYL
jgi:K+-transporting ATPase c subunit